MLKINRKPSKHEVYRFFINTSLVVLGTCILAFGTAIFLVPFDLVTGGMSGLAIIFNRLTTIPVDLCVTILTWAFFFLGLVILNKSFALKTLTSTIVFPIALSLFMKFPEWIPFLRMDYTNMVDTLLASLFGGMLVGTGCGVTYLGGGSTGGLDILAFIICRYQKRVESSKVMFIQDALIVIGGLFIFQDLRIALIGVLSAFIMAVMIDKVFVGKSKEFVAFIVSTNADEIYVRIRDRLDRTVTYINAIGAFSNEKKMMIMVSFTMDQYSKIVDIVSEVDKRAFLTISRAHEIKGEGFDLEVEPIVNDDLEEYK